MREPQFPYVLFGHSVGALISFELARELRRRRFTLPRRLFLSGRRPPTTSSEKDPIFNLADDAFIAEVKRLNGTPKGSALTSRNQKTFLPVLRAGFEIDDTYEYYSEERLSWPITVYWWTYRTGIFLWKVCARGRNRPLPIAN